MKTLRRFNNTTFYKSQQSILITLDIVYQLQQNTDANTYVVMCIYLLFLIYLSLNDNVDSKNNTENNE